MREWHARRPASTILLLMVWANASKDVRKDNRQVEREVAKKAHRQGNGCITGLAVAVPSPLEGEGGR
ncbi:MAG: hypothetical protein WCT04_24435, partial [Planctomycetota bacterium]